MARRAVIKVNVTNGQKATIEARAIRRKMSASSYMLYMALQPKQGPSHQEFLRDICVREQALVALNELAVEVANARQSPSETQSILERLAEIEVRLQTALPVTDDMDIAP